MENHTEVQSNSTKDKGFTLVELLIVIVILGILATVTVFAVRGITDQGETSACAADKKTMEVAIESYFAQNGGSALPQAVITPAVVVNGVTITPAVLGSASQTLVDAGLLRSVSAKYTANADGTLTAVAPCT